VNIGLLILALVIGTGFLIHARLRDLNTALNGE